MYGVHLVAQTQILKTMEVIYLSQNINPEEFTISDIYGHVTRLFSGKYHDAVNPEIVKYDVEQVEVKFKRVHCRGNRNSTPFTHVIFKEA